MGSTTSARQKGWIHHQPQPRRKAEARGPRHNMTRKGNLRPRRKGWVSSAVGSIANTRQQEWIRHQPRPHRKTEARSPPHGVTRRVNLPPSRKRNMRAATMGSTTSTRQQGWIRHQPRPRRKQRHEAFDIESLGRLDFIPGKTNPFQDFNDPSGFFKTKFRINCRHSFFSVAAMSLVRCPSKSSEHRSATHGAP